MFFRIIIPLLFAGLLLPRSSMAEQHSLHLTVPFKQVYGGLFLAATPEDKDLPRLGLALAGGGAKAAASIGVLKVLQEEGIPVAAIAGTSMGAGVGGFYAAGYGPEEIAQIFASNDWNDIFRDTPVRAFQTQEQKEAGSRYLLEFTFQDWRFSPPTGLSAGQKLNNFLAAKTLAASFEADLDFDRLRIPFRAVATDIETGEPVILSHGLLHEAMRASAAVPVMFQPVEIQGHLLVDGGLVNNLPVDVVRSMGMDVVLAVDASSKLEKRERLNSLLEILGQSVSLSVRRETERQAARADLVITPDTSVHSFTDFPNIPTIMRRGEDAARAALPRIRELMRRRGTETADARSFRITSLTIRGNARISEATVRFAVAPVLAPHEATRSDIQSALQGVSNLGYFSEIALDLEQEGAGHRAFLTLRENPVVQAIEVSGTMIVPTADIMAALTWQLGQTLNAARLSAALEELVARYRARGYLLVRVERAAMKADGRTLGVVLYEGKVDSITLAGQSRTRQSLIQRETMTRSGQPLNFDVAAYDIQHLYALDYFESIAVDMDKSPLGGVALLLKIKEKPTNKLRLGLRYDLEDHFTGLTDVVVDNVTGRGIKFYLNTRYGNYTDLTAGYYSPVLIRSYFVHTVQAFYRERTYPIYQNKHRITALDIAREGVEIAFGYQWFRFGDTYLRYRFASDSTVEAFGMDPQTSYNRIGSLALLSTADTRDSSTFAHRGTLFKGCYEMADQGYGGNAEYSKAGISVQKFLPLGARHTVVLEGTAGFGSGKIPYEEKYGIGGVDGVLSTPLLGYQRREFVGDNLLGFGLSYRWKLGDYQLNVLKALYLGMAYQAANVWNDRADLSVRDLRSGVGVGLYADTVIGPVRLDFGAAKDNRYNVSFSAGYDF
jgi:NTE family protein